MSKTYRHRATDQPYLFPPLPRGRLPEGDLVQISTSSAFPRAEARP